MQSYAIALDSCYMFPKKMLNMKLKMILIVFMLSAYIIPELNNLESKQMMNLINCLVCNIIKFFFICLWGGKCFTSLLALELVPLELLE